MRAGGIVESMLATDWIEVRPRARKCSGAIALANRMKVNPVIAGRQIVELQLHVND